MILRQIAVVFLIVAAALPVQAQEEVHYGFKLGVTSAELRSEDFGNATRWGFNAGVFAAIPVRGPFGALAQVDYYRKGYGAGELRDENNTQLGTDADFQYDYTSLLVAARYKDALGSSGMDFYAFVGPRLDLLVADRVVATVDGERETIELDSVFLGDFNSVVLGASAGIGLDLANAVAVPVLVELRYDADVAPVWSNEFSDWRFRTFSLRAGFSF